MDGAYGCTEKKGDRLLHQVKEEYLRKSAIIERLRREGAFSGFIYQRKYMEQELMAFYTSIVVKTFFKNLKHDYLEFVFDANRFVVNSYSYVHIISRHYIAKFNGIDTERTFNSSLPFIDPFNLPFSIVTLISRYFDAIPAEYNLNKEYMIFLFRGEHYIIWWKRKRIEEIGNKEGFEIRTLYKIQSALDLNRISGKAIVQTNDELNFYY